MQTRERQVPVPYFVNVPETKYRTVTEQVPVQRTKVEMDTVTKTVYDTQVRTRCIPETKMVSKQIPVYNVVAKPAPPCPPDADGNVIDDFNRIYKDGDGMLNYNEVAFDVADTNKDGVRSKQVPYTMNRSEKRTRMETQKYTVPVTTTNTRFVPVTKKVPKTVYVDVTENVPQKYTTTTMQTRERQVPVPYFVNVPETKYRTVTEQVPVQRTKVEMDTVTKTVYDTQVRTRCIPETKMVSKQIPVYNVVAKPAPPCPPDADGNVIDDFNRIYKDGDGMLNYNEVAFDVADTNKDGVLSQEEYFNARAAGNLGNTAGISNTVE